MNLTKTSQFFTLFYTLILLKLIESFLEFILRRLQKNQRKLCPGGERGGEAAFVYVGGQNGAQNCVFLVSFRGLILVMLLSSLRNDFYGSRVLFGGAFLFFFACTHT